MRLALRTLFWLTLAVGIAIGWGIEHRKAAGQLKELTEKNRFYLLFMRPQTNEPSADSLARRKKLDELRKVSDEGLLAIFVNSKPDGGWPNLYSEYDLCLVELARRRMTDALQQAYDTLMADTADEDAFRFRDNTKLLTALRRAQGQPDPLKIHVELKHNNWSHIPRTAPILLATVENVDIQQETVHLEEGLDDRSGRRTRWRVHLYDEEGNRVPDSSFSGGGMGGGIGTMGGLPFGEKGDWKNWLDARSYVQPPPAGRYKLQVIHTPDSVDIAEEPDLTGLIVSQSDPIDVIVSQPVTPKVDKGISVLPLLVVLCLACIAAAIVVWNRNRAMNSEHPRRPALLMGRDLIALALITLLALIWHLDVRYLNQRIRGSQLDQDSNWTMRLADQETLAQ